MYFGGLELSLRQHAVEKYGCEPTPIVTIPSLLHRSGARFLKIPCIAGLVRRLLYQTTTSGVELTDGSECASTSDFNGDVAEGTLGHPPPGSSSTSARSSVVSFCIHRDVFEQYPFVLESGTGLIVQDVTAIVPPGAGDGRVDNGAVVVVVCLRNVHAVLRSQQQFDSTSNGPTVSLTSPAAAIFGASSIRSAPALRPEPANNGSSLPPQIVGAPGGLLCQPIVASTPLHQQMHQYHHQLHHTPVVVRDDVDLLEMGDDDL